MASIDHVKVLGAWVVLPAVIESLAVIRTWQLCEDAGTYRLVNTVLLAATLNEKGGNLSRAACLAASTRHRMPEVQSIFLASYELRKRQ